MQLDQLKEFPPFYQMQNGDTNDKQLQLWEQRLLQHFKSKNIYFADFQTLLHSQVCYNSDKSIKIQKQLLQEILLHMESNQNLIFQDEKKQSFYIFDSSLREYFVEIIIKQAGDDVLTMTEIEEMMNKDKHLAKMPQQLILILLQAETKSHRRIQLVYDRQNKVQGIKILS